MKLKIEYVDINSIKPYKNNAKTHPREQIEQIKKSIEKFGMDDPIGIWKDEIVEGHGRLIACKELGMTEVPIIRLDHLTDEERKAYTLAHNKLTMNSDFDLDILNQELLTFEKIDMSDFGFDLGFDEEEPEIIEDEVPDIPEEPKAKLGDIYQLGNHRLMCGDSTKKEDVAKLMNNEKADISFTSPPYNAGTTPTEIKMKIESKYSNDDDNKSIEDYTKFLIDFTNNAMQYSRYTFVNVQSLSNNKIALINYLYEFKTKYADTIIWDKMLSQPAMAENVLNSEFEYIHIFSEKGNRAIGTINFRGTLKNIIHIKKQLNNEFSDIHNATFSLEFAQYFIKNFAKNSVLDLFGGTGTTLIVSELLKRKCYMMELDPHYIDVIIQRWENFTGEKAILLNRKEEE